MRRIHAFAFVLLAGLSGAAIAQVSVNVNLDFGDPVIDNGLGYIAPYYAGDYDPFIDDVVVRYSVPRPYVRELVYVHHVPLPDVLLISAYSHQLGWPMERVYGVYHENRGRGWGVIAQRLGIRPGSPEFHAMKAQLRGDPMLVRAYDTHGHRGGPPPGHGHGYYDNDQGRGHGHDYDGGPGHGHGHGHGHDSDDDQGSGHGHGHDNDHGNGHGHGGG